MQEVSLVVMRCSYEITVGGHVSVGGGRARVRGRMLRRAALVIAALVLIALLLLASGHWVLGIVFGVAAVAAIWVYLQLRTVR
jgi:hypothetical protein